MIISETNWRMIWTTMFVHLDVELLLLANMAGLLFF